DSVQVQRRIAGMRIRQIVPADQLWDQRSTAPQILSINARLDVVPVEKSQKVSMAVAANPCSPGIFTWKKCSSTGEIRTHWRNSPRARQFFVAIHTGDVAFFRRNEGQRTHSQSATGNSTARPENASQSLKTVHNPVGRFPRRRFSAL